VAEADEFAVYSPVAPRRVSAARRTISWRSSTGVCGLPRRCRGGWVQCLAIRLRCQRSNVSGVTIQPWRSRRGRAAAIAPSGPVLVVRSGTLDLAAQHAELVAKHDDLEVFRASRTESEAGKCSDETVEESRHDRPGWSIIPGQQPRASFRALHDSVARRFCIADRRLLAPGYKADVNIFDPSRVGPTMPWIENDLSGGGRRLKQRSEGILATVVAGKVTLENGEVSGEMPGTIVCGSR